jgi:hypothetical protein
MNEAEKTEDLWNMYCAVHPKAVPVINEAKSLFSFFVVSR